MFGGKKNQTTSNDGVQYKRSKTWRIALSQLNSASAMCFYILIGYASYVGNVGYGIATAVVGVIITCTRIFDGITDPIIALIIDKTNTRFGKLRLFMIGGWLLETLAVFLLYVWCSGKGNGVFLFILLYVLYIIGYTMNNVAGQIIPPVLTNDPKQRPMVGVWATIYNYLVPMLLMMGITVYLLPKFGGAYTVPMLSASCILCVTVSLILEILSCIGVSEADKPENFEGISVNKNKEKVKLRDMWNLLKGNRSLQTYIMAAASDKLAQNTASQAVVSTLLFGIVIGNIEKATLISTIAMFPSIIFAIVGAKYAGKHGNKESIVTWSTVCIAIAAASVLFFIIVDPKQITQAMIPTALFFIFIFFMNSAKMCVTTATGAMCADIIDYELDRSGKYMPAAVTATYSFIDKLISSLGATIAAGSVALIGYTVVMPQPTDESSTPIFIMAMLLYYGLPVLGWVCSLIAMKFCPLSKEKMVEVQKRIQEKKAAETEKFLADKI